MTLRELRKSRSLTLMQVAAETDINFTSLSKYETGDLPLPNYLKPVFCKFYGVDNIDIYLTQVNNLKVKIRELRHLKNRHKTSITVKHSATLGITKYFCNCCGKEIQEDFVYCAYCGSEIKRGTE